MQLANHKKIATGKTNNRKVITTTTITGKSLQPRNKGKLVMKQQATLCLRMKGKVKINTTLPSNTILHSQVKHFIGCTESYRFYRASASTITPSDFKLLY
jgi:hypothetical protein